MQLCKHPRLTISVIPPGHQFGISDDRASQGRFRGEIGVLRNVY
jgi:hypothetical protein